MSARYQSAAKWKLGQDRKVAPVGSLKVIQGKIRGLERFFGVVTRVNFVKIL